MNNMEASSSSSPFFGLREENFQAPPTHQQPPQLQLEQHSLAGTRAPASSSIGPPQKKKRSLPGAPSKYPDADVIALSPRTLMATNRFVCEVCNKGFQREQNLQLHRRGHNLPWKLKQKNKQDPVRKKVYLCPEPSCVHHDPSRALGDLTGIKKHYFRKHGEKKFKCEKCAKRYAVQSDWKAHSKTCGTREYRCDCGTLFSRRDSFITHRAFCDALAQESRQSTSLSALSSHLLGSTGDNVIGGGGNNNNMSLGMGLSHQVTSHLDHQLASNILRLGGGPRHYDRLLGSPFRPQQPPPNNFYSPDHQLGLPNQSNGGGFGNCGQDQNQNQNQNQNQGQSAGGGMFSVSNNLFHGQLNQLQNLQGGGNSQAFNNLGFFNSNNINNNNNSTTDTNTMNSGSTGSGDNSSGLFSPGTGLYGGPVVQMNSSNNGGGLSSLYNDNGGSITLQHQSAMSSATALLQKAAQMGSTTSTTNANAMKGFIMAKPPQPPPSPPTSSGGGFQGFYGETDQNNNLHDQLIRDLSRDNNNNNHLMNSSPFRDGGNHYYRGHNGGIDANNKPVQGGLSAVSSSENPTRDFLGVGAIVRSNKSGGNSNNGISMANLNAHNAASNNNNSNAISNTNDVNYPMPISSNQPYGGGNGFH